MNMSALSVASLPALRQDLTLFEGPSNTQGAPTWSLHDPVRNLYFTLDWASFEILSRWSLGSAQQIVDDIVASTTLQLTSASVDGVRDFLIKSELIQIDREGQVSTLAKVKKQQQAHWIKRLLHIYLFFRVPLVKPDRFLSNHLEKVKWLGSGWFTSLTLVAALLGIWEITRQWGAYQATLVDMLNPTGLLYYGLTLALLKVAHEFGHAFVAKAYGCRVPRMGLAFLVFFPVAYTDVNDAWRLPSSRARLQIGAAGIRVELVLAAWSSLLWALLPEGYLKTVAYLVSSTTWISTLLINASPFMRFDGYFIFMDAINLPNLHQRSFAMGRWLIARYVLGLNQPKPEALGRSTERFLMAFAYGTWLYRLTLFSGIAWMVYQTIPKPLGPFLAAVEWWWFILKPIYTQLRVWFAQMSSDSAAEGVANANTSALSKIVNGYMQLPRLTRWLLLIVLLLLIFPWSSSIRTEGLIKPRVVKQFQLSQAGLLIDLPGNVGRREVSKGELLAEFQSDALALEQAQQESRLKQIEHQIQQATLINENAEQLSVLLAERQELVSRLRAAETQSNTLQWIAAKPGYFYMSDPDLRTGDWAAKSEVLAVLFDAQSPELFAYVNVDELARLQVGDKGRFYPDSATVAPFEVSVVSLTDDAMPVLDDPMLATEQGGRVSAKNVGRHYQPDKAIYKIVLQLESVPEGWQPSLKSTGRVVISGESESIIRRYATTAMAFVQRELGL